MLMKTAEEFEENSNEFPINSLVQSIQKNRQFFLLLPIKLLYTALFLLSVYRYKEFIKNRKFVEKEKLPN